MFGLWYWGCDAGMWWCRDSCTCLYWSPNMYINSFTYPLHRTTIIHQPNRTDVVITTLGFLGRWSHPDQFLQIQIRILCSQPICWIFQIRNSSNNSFLNSSNMTTSPVSQLIMTDKDYCQIALDMIQGYAEQELEGKFFWESIKKDFKR